MKFIIFLLVGFAAARPQEQYDHPSYGSDSGVSSPIKPPIFHRPQIEEYPDAYAGVHFNEDKQEEAETTTTTEDDSFWRKTRDAGGEEKTHLVDHQIPHIPQIEEYPAGIPSVYESGTQEEVEEDNEEEATTTESYFRKTRGSGDEEWKKRFGISQFPQIEEHPSAYPSIIDSEVEEEEDEDAITTTTDNYYFLSFRKARQVTEEETIRDHDDHAAHGDHEGHHAHAVHPLLRLPIDPRPQIEEKPSN